MISRNNFFSFILYYRERQREKERERERGRVRGRGRRRERKREREKERERERECCMFTLSGPINIWFLISQSEDTYDKRLFFN